MFDLTAFQRDLLIVIAGHDGDAVHGLGIKETLEDRYGAEINHGRLYPNLDELAEKGLIVKEDRAIDDRTNGYAVTERGKRELRDRRHWVGETLGDAIDPERVMGPNAEGDADE